MSDRERGETDLADSDRTLSGKTTGRRADSRVRRTRSVLVEAFNRLLLGGRHRRIGVREVIAEAGVGRSTFYEHFGSADELHLRALERPLAQLADAAAGTGDETALARILAHFWDNRARARDTFSGRMGEHAARLLSKMVEDRLGKAPLRLPRQLASQQLAQAALAPVKGC
jgi:AcrR family transcriptional regulator